MKIKKRIFLSLSVLLMLSACKDPCKDYDCGNGTCTDLDGEATCVCDAGYEGDQCDEMVKTKFLGTYDVTETCDGSSSAARTLTISSGAGNSDIIFDNLIIGEQQDAVIDSTGTNFEIPPQTLFNGTINGSGSINVTTGVVSFTYYQNYPGYPEIVCSGTLTPQ